MIPLREKMDDADEYKEERQRERVYKYEGHLQDAKRGRK